MLKVSPLPAGEPVCDDFAVLVNHEIILPCYCARVSAVPYNTWWPGRQRPLNQTEIASFAVLETDEPAHIRIESKKPVSEIIIRPLSKNIIPEIIGDNIIEFVIENPGQYSVEINGIKNPLTLFVNPIADFGVEINRPGVIYFGPGIHRPGVIDVKSGQTVLIDSGAVVYGAVLGIGVDNARIVGYGILDGSWEERSNDTLAIPFDISRIPNNFPSHVGGSDTEFSTEPQKLRKFLSDTDCLNTCIRFYGCQNIEINGIICRDSSCYAILPANCDGVTIDNVKLIGMWRYNSDGIDILNCSNVTIRNCYLRNFDDCVVIKGQIGWDSRNTENILVQNCVIWCDWGRALEIGAETSADEIRDIIFEDCDIIHGAHVMMDIQNADRAYVHGVTFQNIRCEYSKHTIPAVYQNDINEPYPGDKRDFQPQPALFAACSFCGVFSNDNKLGCISNITFRNIDVICEEDMPMPFSHIQGAYEKYNTTEHNTTDVLFENIRLNGRRMKTIEEANININAKTTENIRLI